MEATRDVESGAERALDRVGFTASTHSLRGNNLPPLSRSSLGPQTSREPEQARLESRRLLAITDVGSSVGSWHPPWWVAAIGLVVALLIAGVSLSWLRWSPSDATAHDDASKEVGTTQAAAARLCCEEQTAECMACKVGWSVDEFCAGREHREVAGCEGQCCKEERAECLACQVGWSINEYCAKHGATQVAGCDRQHRSNCCTTMSAQCLACRDGMTTEAYCAKPENAKVTGCTEDPDSDQPMPRPLQTAPQALPASTTTTPQPDCCQERSAKCLACKASLSIGEFCLEKENAKVSGCAGFCGLVEDNYVYPGGNLFTIKNVASAQSCCQRCRNLDNCTSWSWGKRPGAEYHGVCYLKNQEELIRRKDKAFVSGLPGRNTLTFQIKNRHGICLDWAEHLHLAACGDSTKESQQWYIDRRAGVIGTRHGLCIDSVEYLSQGGGIHLQPCTANIASQLWNFDGVTGLIRHVRGFCMDALDFAKEGSKVRMWPCDGTSEQQLWSLWNTLLLGESATQQAIRLEALTTTTTTTSTSSTTTVTTTELRITPLMSLFCWSLMLPWGYEHSLLTLQHKLRRSIFACDQTAVYSSSVINVSSNDSKVPFRTRVVDYDLHCKIGGQFQTALNTPIFVHVWKKVIDDGFFRDHAWTIKADPDAVFFPARLRTIVGKKEEAQVKNGMILVNCKFGLHGPLEVVSRRALEVYELGWSTCRRPPQEDVFLQACMLSLHVKQVDAFDLLSEEHCKSKGWALCQSVHVAFHPFKTVQRYEGCLANADRFDEAAGQPGVSILNA